MEAARHNVHGQPVGAAIPDWSPRALPSRAVMPGRFCRIEPLDIARHAPDLYEANAEDADGRNWTYLGVERPGDVEAYRTWLAAMSAGDDPMVFAIIDGAMDRAVGLATYLRIDRANGSIEVGHLNFSPRLQRRPAATEAMYLMMRHAFEAGYRRYEWKCDSLNLPSRKAAERLGLRFEGIFRQAVVYKGRSRDTAWFSIIDGEWPALKAAFEAWLSPDNFHADGRQRRRLEEFRSRIG